MAQMLQVRLRAPVISALLAAAYMVSKYDVPAWVKQSLPAESLARCCSWAQLDCVNLGLHTGALIIRLAVTSTPETLQRAQL